MTKQEAYYMNPTVLAYLGDAVYEQFVRETMVLSGQVHADRLHHGAVRYVRAEGQALAIKQMFEHLTAEEQALVKRARNKKITSKPRNVDIHAYKWATAFEALMGYLHLSGQTDRMKELMAEAIRRISDAEHGSAE
ncbi:MAG: Mini-ribonuclease 3 [Firmicutes bacterium]|jgi:ribonuclease-3 family protein|nr:Mini-ribonuclease 3 [Bacillota bacterium]MBQ5798043.1 Mini-ribonuclease 3 [Bacillota bacterium]